MATVLDKIMQPKRFFDVESDKDIKVFTNFLKKNAWGKECCPFELEEPYLTVPDMIKDKLIHKFLKVKK